MTFIFFLHQDDAVDAISTFFKEASGYLTLIITVVGFVLGAILKLVSMKKDVLRKMIKAIGKGKLMDILLKINEMTDRVPMDVLDAFINKCGIELDMKDIAGNLNTLLSVKEVLREPSVNEVMAEYKKKHDYGVLRDKKRWNEIRRDPRVDKALDALVNHLVDKYHKQVTEANEKGNVAQMKQLVATIMSDENVLKNRAKRKKIETFNEGLRAREKDAYIKKLQEKLFDTFKVKDEK